MAGLTRVERKLLDWVDDKYAGQVISQMNTEWEQRVDEHGAIAPETNEYQYMRARILEIHRSANKGEAPDETEAED